MKIEPHRTVRYYYLRFLRLQGDPHFLARGVAIGVFIGITPTIPFHTILALGLAFLLRGSKIAALLLTVMVSNPLTFFFQYYFSWRLGNLLTMRDLSLDKIYVVIKIITSNTGFNETITALGKLGQETIVVLIIGGAVLAAPFAVIGYMVAYYFFSTWQSKLRKRNRASQTNSSTIPLSPPTKNKPDAA